MTEKRNYADLSDDELMALTGGFDQPVTTSIISGVPLYGIKPVAIPYYGIMPVAQPLYGIIKPAVNAIPLYGIAPN